MDQRDETVSGFGVRWKRLLTDLAIVGALSLCQAWGSMLQRAGSGYFGAMLMTMALVMAFALGKTLGERRGIAS
jgi:hypothetical protein